MITLRASDLPNGVVGLVVVAVLLGLPSAGRAAPALRVRLALEGGEVRLLSKTPVEKVLPPSESPAVVAPAAAAVTGETGARRGGSWFEVRSAAGQILYQRLMADPRVVYFEGPSSPGSTALSRIEAVADRRVVELVIPRTPEAADLVLFVRHRADGTGAGASPTAPPPTDAAVDGITEELARVPLR